MIPSPESPAEPWHVTAALLVDSTTRSVVGASEAAVRLSGGVLPPVPLDRWCLAAGLCEAGGQDPCAPQGLLTRALRGEVAVGRLVLRDAPATHPAGGLDEDAVGGSGSAPLPGPALFPGSVLAPGPEPTLGMGSLPGVESLPGVGSSPGAGSLPGVGTTAGAGVPHRWGTGGIRVVCTPLVASGLPGDVVPAPAPAPAPAQVPAGCTLVVLSEQSDLACSPGEGGASTGDWGRSRAVRERADLLAAVDALALGGDDVPVLAALARLLVPGTASGALIASVDGDLEIVAVAGDVPPDVVGRRRRLGESTDPGDQLATVVGGQQVDPVRVAAGPLRRRPGTTTAWFARVLPAETPLLALPVRGRRGPLAVVLLVDPSEDPEDLAVVREMLTRVGLALENARLHAREHALAETLQRSLLPGPVVLPDLDVWAHYAPNTELTQVGGDWYDVISRPDGSHGIVIGDVVGHDLEAAAVMGQLRSIARAYAYEVHDAAAVLDRVDQLAFSMQLSRLASAAFLTFARDATHWRVTWANAGHLAPLHKRGPQVTPLRAPEGSLLGLICGERRSLAENLRGGDFVVLYTDGLVERRGRTAAEGMARLARVIGSSPAATAAELGTHILDQVGQDPEDDLALVVVRVPRASDGFSRMRRRSFEPTEHAPRQARAFAMEWLRGLHRGNDEAPLLVVSELVANATRHGEGLITLALSTQEGRVRVQVDDESPVPPRLTPEIDAGGGQGLRIVSRLADWGWTPAVGGKSVWAVLRDERPAAAGPAEPAEPAEPSAVSPDPAEPPGGVPRPG